jgi:hypothetical protein
MAGLVPVVALVSLVGPATPTAYADAIDNNFLAALKAKGINFASERAAIVAGHMVCDQLDLGRQPADVTPTPIAAVGSAESPAAPNAPNPPPKAP